jgi:hypothetical protein
MHEMPAVPAVADAPGSLFDGGHLWVQEFVEGDLLRVQLQGSGLLSFGSLTEPFDGEIPLEHRHAVRHVREQFDRGPLREALDDVTSVTLLGVVTHGAAVSYDRDALPPFLLVDVWSDADDELLPPDAVDRLATNLGLESLPAVRKEVRAADFDPAGFEFPPSTWREGSAASVLVRNKTGDRARIANPAVQRPTSGSSESSADSPADLAAELVTEARIDRALDSPDSGVPDADSVTERVVEHVAHETPDALSGAQTAVDLEAFRSEAGALVRRRLNER